MISKHREEVEKFIMAWGWVPKWIDPAILTAWLKKTEEERFKTWVESACQARWETFTDKEKRYVEVCLKEWLWG